MTCPRHDVLIALGDGELPESQARSVRAHAGGCTRCQSELAELDAIADDLRAPMPGALGRRSAEDFADEVLAKLDARRTEPRESRIPRWIGLLAAAAVLPLAVTAAHHLAQAPRATSEWTARGGSSAPATMRTLVTFGRVSGTTFEPLADGARLEADALLAAEIGGTEGPPRFLLAFLVDGAGERHWIYPSYEPGAPPPSSIALPVTVTPRVLGSMVRLDRPASGRARLVAIVLQRSESVDYIEQAPRGELSSEQLEAHYPGALVITTSVEVP
ncbi:MAG: hypothetical protein BGO98_36885 [Myxococcales bacterium 68-20]|nr:MAG: hypothetical protein BGO98_36885 [Myxococcales bacterium 68-20]